MVVGTGQEENADNNGAAAGADVQQEPRRGVSGLPRGVQPVNRVSTASSMRRTRLLRARGPKFSCL